MSLNSLVCLLAAAVCFILTACGPNSSSRTKEIVFLQANATDSYHSRQNEILTQLLSSSPSTVLRTENAEGDSRKQSTQLEQAIAAKSYAIFIECTEAAILTPLIQTATGNGIFVIGLGEDSLTAGCATVLYYEDTELGRLAGKAAIQKRSAQSATATSGTEALGRIIEIRGDEISATSNKRHRGFMAEIEAASAMSLIHDAPGYWTQEGGAERMTDALKLQKGFDVVFAHNDLMAHGAAEASGTTRSKVFIIGIDGLEGATGGCTLVQSGKIDATIHRPLLVDFAWQLLTRKIENPYFTPKPSYRLSPQLLQKEDITDSRVKQPLPFPEI